MKAKRLLQLTMLFFSISFNAIAQVAPPQEPGNCGCRTTQIRINTGINHSTGTILAPGTFDPMWTVTTVPATSGLSTPAIPYVIPAASVWGSSTPALQATLNSSSGWLSPFNTASYSINNPAPANPFTFRLDFCVCEGGQYRIDGLLNADDQGELWLDGTTMIANCPGWSSVIPFTMPIGLTAGSHFLELRLRNTGAQVMGIALSGTITSASGANSLMGYDCCRPVGGINGRKYIDKDCDGKLTGADEPAQGWQFTLSPGGYTATSDILGYYNFPSLPAGTYTLTEVPQPGWTAISPAGGTTTVTVTPGSVTTINFLNSNCNEDCDLECYWRVTGNNTINPSINYLGTNNLAPVIIKTNGTQRAVIQGNGDGNIGIATTTPTTILDVYAAPPPAGAPSGLRFENLPRGKGYILVVDDQGYVYRTERTQASKPDGAAMDMMALENQLTELRQEISTLKSLVGSSEGSTLTVSPNPASGQAKATYHIAGSYSNAVIKVTDKTGRLIMTTEVTGNDGTAVLTLPGSTVSGDVICTLIVNGKIAATQKLVLLNK